MAARKARPAAPKVQAEAQPESQAKPPAALETGAVFAAAPGTFVLREKWEPGHDLVPACAEKALVVAWRLAPDGFAHPIHPAPGHAIELHRHGVFSNGEWFKDSLDWLLGFAKETA